MSVLLVAVAVILAWAFYKVITDRKKGIAAFETKKAAEGFSTSKELLDGRNGIAIDEQKRELLVMNNLNVKKVKFADILSSEIKFDERVITKKSTISRALVGGVLAGGVGAIVGGMSGSAKTIHKFKKVDLALTIRNLQDPLLKVSFLKAYAPVKSDSALARKAIAVAEEWHAVMKVIIDQEDQKTSA